jgi:hypothetical protein
MKTIFNFIDTHPFLAGAIAFYVLFYCLFFYYSLTHTSEIVEDWDINWKQGKQDNF